jgi:hypothetical protein
VSAYRPPLEAKQALLNQGEGSSVSFVWTLQLPAADIGGFLQCLRTSGNERLHARPDVVYAPIRYRPGTVPMAVGIQTDVLAGHPVAHVAGRVRDRRGTEQHTENSFVLGEIGDGVDDRIDARGRGWRSCTAGRRPTRATGSRPQALSRWGCRLCACATCRRNETVAPPRTPASAFPQRSSPTPRGCLAASPTATITSKSSWPSAAVSLPTRRLGTAAASGSGVEEGYWR